MKQAPIKKLSKIELKAKSWAGDYVNNNFNGTEATIKNYKVKSRKVAQAIASENLSKPVFQKAIQEVINDTKGLKKSTVLSKLSSNIHQGKHLPSSNSAMDMYFKLGGDYAPDKKVSTHLNININDNKAVEQRLKDIRGELKRLTEEG